MKDSLNIKNVVASDPPRATRYHSSSDFKGRADSNLTRIMGMIPMEIMNVETKIAESNRKKLVLAFWNFAGMVFGALQAVAKEMRLQNDFKKTQENWKEDLGFGTDEGQLISKWPFHCLQISQKQCNFCKDFCPTPLAYKEGVR